MVVAPMAGVPLPDRFILIESTTLAVEDHVRQHHAISFSVAGPPILRGDRFSFSDDGSRHEFLIEDGRVLRLDGDQRSDFSTSLLSSDRVRAPEPTTPPRFSMVAAGGGRVFAKVEGRFSFAFGAMEPADLFFDPDQEKVIPIANARFALDPEHNRPGAKVQDLIGPLLANKGRHPATERNALLAQLLHCNGLGFMVVFMEPRRWHWLDARPPLLTFDDALSAQSVLRLNPFWLLGALVQLGTTKSVDLRAVGEAARELLAPPNGPPPQAIAGLVTHAVATYASQPNHFGPFPAPQPDVRRTPEIQVQEVLGIGVGHVHLHEQYERRYGGELQPTQTKTPGAANERLYAAAYRLFNGPVRDFDGFIDGTCNYYALCRITGEDAVDRYRILWIDEQTFFARRWRVLHPDHDSAGMMFSLVNDLRVSPALYQYEPGEFWCPFLAGCVDGSSRMAVSRQVILVTGQDHGQPELFSINFSWSSCDRSWRWRRYPAEAVVLSLPNDEAAVDERLAPGQADAQAAVFPQTLRLREDMTIAIKGLKRIEERWLPGRWIQKYLPADNRHVPEFLQSIPSAPPPKPSEGYGHPWDFLSEPAFVLADRYTHFGVYQPVNSRSQYYRVDLKPDAIQLLRASGHDEADEWVAAPRSLYINMVRVDWQPGITGGKLEVTKLVNARSGPPLRQDTSMYEPGAFTFRLLNRDELGWIAVYADKRDDDLAELSDLPKRVMLTRKSKTSEQVEVTFRDNVPVYDSPVVELATVALRRGSAGTTEVTLTLRTSLTPAAFLQALWCVRAGAVLAGGPKVLFELRRTELVRDGDSYRGIVLCPDAVGTLLTEAARQQFATSIWFEDIVGHVATSERLELPATFP